LPASVNATIGNGMSYTLASAATACGVNKSTILRAIKAGKISGTRDEHNEWHVEPAELHRVYPPAERSGEGNGAAHRYAAPDAAAIQLAGLVVEVGIAKEAADKAVKNKPVENAKKRST
jgi:hypothetical protein